MVTLSTSDETCRITILVLAESSMMCVASVLEPFRAANRVGGSQLYEWELTSLTGEPVELTCGIPLPIEKRFDDRMSGDLLVIISGFNQERHVNATALSIIRKAASRFNQVAGVEAGSWVLARTGLLDGGIATTHWEDFEAFASRFPEIDLRLDRFVRDGKCMTCGGASPAFDMFLEFIRNRNGPTIGMEVASVFVYDEAHSGFEEQPLVSLGKLVQREPRIGKAVRLMEKWIEQPLPVAAIAKRVGVSSNTLEALFKKHVGMTPGRFYLNMRLKSANRMVLDSSLSMREIAVRSGFNSLSAFSRAYRLGFGRPPNQVRSDSS